MLKALPVVLAMVATQATAMGGQLAVTEGCRFLNDPTCRGQAQTLQLAFGKEARWVASYGQTRDHLHYDMPLLNRQGAGMQLQAGMQLGYALQAEEVTLERRFRPGVDTELRLGLFAGRAKAQARAGVSATFAHTAMQMEIPAVVVPALQAVGRVLPALSFPSQTIAFPANIHTARHEKQEAAEGYYGGLLLHNTYTPALSQPSLRGQFSQQAYAGFERQELQIGAGLTYGRGGRGDMFNGWRSAGGWMAGVGVYYRGVGKDLIAEKHNEAMVKGALRLQQRAEKALGPVLPHVPVSLGSFQSILPRMDETPEKVGVIAGVATRVGAADISFRWQREAGGQARRSLTVGWRH